MKQFVIVVDRAVVPVSRPAVDNSVHTPAFFFLFVTLILALIPTPVFLLKNQPATYSVRTPLQYEG